METTKRGPTLLICHPGLAGRSFQSIQGVQLFPFFDSLKGDAEFRRRAAATIGMQFDKILDYLKNDYHETVVYSDDRQGLEYLADKYRQFSGADKRKARRKKEDTSQDFPVENLVEYILNNKKQIIKAKSEPYSCPRLKGAIHTIRVKFKDGETLNFLPVDIKVISGQNGRYELKFIRPYMNIVFYYDQKVEKRLLSIPRSGDVLWISQGKSYPIDRNQGFSRYTSFSTRQGRINSSCELQKVTSKVIYH